MTIEAQRRPRVRIEGGARVCIYCNRVLTFNFMRDDGGDCTCARAKAEAIGAGASGGDGDDEELPPAASSA